MEWNGNSHVSWSQTTKYNYNIPYSFAQVAIVCVATIIYRNSFHAVNEHNLVPEPQVPS